MAGLRLGMRISPLLLPILNGLIGDKLAAGNKPWAIQMSFRLDGKDIDTSDLKQVKGKRVVLFVHGLMADEGIWKHISKAVGKQASCLYLRYNTGLHISENGQKLDELLHLLERKFAPKEIMLAGHSMGGLVIRSACHYGSQKGHPWTRKVLKIFLLAVPNDGAPLEKLGYATSLLLRKIARFQLGLIGNILEQRSNGIKDLGLGCMLEEDWKTPKAAFKDHFKRTPVPALARVTYYILVGNLLKNDQTFMAKYFGDGLVTHGSAISDTLMHVSEVKIFAGTGHNSLIKSKDVCDYVAEMIRRL